MVLGSSQPLTEMSTRSISWGVKSGRCVRFTTYHHPRLLYLHLLLTWKCWPSFPWYYIIGKFTKIWYYFRISTKSRINNIRNRLHFCVLLLLCFLNIHSPQNSFHQTQQRGIRTEFYAQYAVRSCFDVNWNWFLSYNFKYSLHSLIVSHLPYSRVLQSFSSDTRVTI